MNSNMKIQTSSIKRAACGYNQQYHILDDIFQKVCFKIKISTGDIINKMCLQNSKMKYLKERS